MHVASIILAAGKGTRMKSSLPKVLIPLFGRPLVQWVIDALKDSGVEKHCLVVGGDVSQFDPIFESNSEMTVCQQVQRRGTGDAVAASFCGFNCSASEASFMDGKLLKGTKISSEYVLVCTGDAPHLDSSILREFMDDSMKKGADLSVVGMTVPDPTGYGRIVVDRENRFEAIVEEKDANETQKKISLCNSGVIFGKTNLVFDLVTKLTTSNSQKEYYFTDCFSLAKDHGYSINVFETCEWQRFLGINTPEQLEHLADLIKS